MTKPNPKPKTMLRLKGTMMFYPKVDAVAQLDVTVLPQDSKGAVPLDPCRCEIARAVNRASGQAEGSTIIFKHAAWVLRPVSVAVAKKHPYVKVGELAFHHYRIDVATRRAIEEFDRTGAMPPGAFTFLPMPPHSTMTANRIRKRGARKGGTQGPKGRITTRVPFQRTPNFTFVHG